MDSLAGGDPVAAAAAAARLANEFDKDKLIQNVKNQAINGITDAIKDRIFGGPQTNATANSPTNSSTPTIVNIANQGTVTGANNSKTTVGGTPTAGGQITSVKDAANRATGAIIDSIFGGG
jgi:hypothetical protein